jgi:hypothetical protein
MKPFFFLLLLLSIVSCSRTKWIERPEPVQVLRPGSVKGAVSYVKLANLPSASQPMLELELQSIQLVEYERRLEAQRHVQRYQIRPLFAVLGLSGAVVLGYPALESDTKLTRQQRLTRYALAGVSAVLGFTIMKPVGKPVATKEKKLTGSLGTVLVQDTVSVRSSGLTPAWITIQKGDQRFLDRQKVAFIDGKLMLDLRNELKLKPVTDADPGVLDIFIEAEGHRTQLNLRLSSIMNQYARIQTESAAIRSEPRIRPSNILAELANDSQLRYQETFDQDWVKVYYGVASTYVRRDEVDLIWRFDVSGNESLIRTDAEANFGRVDIERDLPTPIASKGEWITLMIGNADFFPNIVRRRVAHRNVEIVDRYFTEQSTLNPKERVLMLNPERFDIDELLGLNGNAPRLNASLNDSSQLFIYISGKGYYDVRDPGYLQYLPSDTNPEDPLREAIRMNDLFRAIHQLSFKRCVILVDMDFQMNIHTNTPVVPDFLDASLYRMDAAELLNRPEVALIFSNAPSEYTGEYVSKDRKTNNRYSIATYYFLKAIKDRRRQIGDIFNYMENNVNFTSRLLHDRPQTPLFLGDPTIRLTER